MTGVKLPDGADVDDLLDELVSLKQFGFDKREHETLKMMRDSKLWRHQGNSVTG